MLFICMGNGNCSQEAVRVYLAINTVHTYTHVFKNAIPIREAYSTGCRWPYFVQIQDAISLKFPLRLKDIKNLMQTLKAVIMPLLVAGAGRGGLRESGAETSQASRRDGDLVPADDMP